MRLARLSSALIGAALVATPALAQIASAATTETAKTNVPLKPTAKSLDCSKQADAKNVHGEARKTFMSSC